MYTAKCLTPPSKSLLWGVKIGVSIICSTVPDLVKYEEPLCFYLNCRKVGLSGTGGTGRWVGDPVGLRLFFQCICISHGSRAGSPGVVTSFILIAVFSSPVASLCVGKWRIMVDLPSLGSFIYGPERLGVTLNWI